MTSVRISSRATYNTGLFILDLNRAPWGCGKLVSCHSIQSLSDPRQVLGPRFGRWVRVYGHMYVIVDILTSEANARFRMAR